MKKKFSYITPIHPEAPRGRMSTKFGTAVGVADVITCDILAILYGVENRHVPLTKPVAVKTGLALPRSS